MSVFTEAMAMTKTNKETVLAEMVEAGATDEVMELARDAEIICSGHRVVLPAHRYEGLSRGRGWARQGRGENALWGERVSGGYEVGPGKWVVGGHDGFRRKGSNSWTVKCVRAGDKVFTVAS